MKYDSTLDTLGHIAEVRNLMMTAAIDIMVRGETHDETKLESPEKEGFDNASHLKTLVYGSEEYKQSLIDLQTTLDHHYKYNSHHPQHYDTGIDGMNLIDVLEMLLDWKAATLRHETGNIIKSLEINKERFKISDQLYQILLNTVEYLNLDQ